MSAIKQEKLKLNFFRQRSFPVVRGLFELEWGQFEVIFGILRYPCVLMGGIFKDLYDGIQISSGRVFSGSPIYDSLSLISQSFWYFFDHQSLSDIFSKIFFCPRWQVENSTLTLKFWALKSKGVNTSFGARITLVITQGLRSLTLSAQKT